MARGGYGVDLAPIGGEHEEPPLWPALALDEDWHKRGRLSCGDVADKDEAGGLLQRLQLALTMRSHHTQLG